MSAAPRLLAVQVIRPEPTWNGIVHEHDLHELVYVVRGEYAVEVDGQVLRGKPGDVFIYARGHRHQPLFSQQARTLLILAQWQEADGVAVARPVQVRDTSRRLLTLLEWLLELHPASNADAASAAARILDLLLYAHAGAGHAKDEGAMRSVREYMREHLADRLRLDDLARAAGMSRFHFARRFAAAIGAPPMRCLQRMRAEAARALVTNTSLPLAEIAQRVGLGNAFYLSRVFSREFGVPPSSLRPSRAARSA